MPCCFLICPTFAICAALPAAPGALLITAKNSVFFTDGRYTEQARDEVRGARVIIARKAPWQAASEWLVARTGRARARVGYRVGIEAQHLSLENYRRLASTLGSGFRLRAAPPLVEESRMVKDADEIARIREAAVLGASLFQTILQGT